MPDKHLRQGKQHDEQKKRQQQHRQAMQSIIERAKEKKPTSADSLTMLREDRER